MKAALKRLKGHVRDRWHLAQARVAIACCNRRVARRRRLRKATPVRHYFAPGVIEAGPARRVVLRPYLVKALIIVGTSAAVLLLRGLSA